MSERGEMEAAIEAILFVSSEPVPRARLVELFEEDEREAAAAALAAVLERFAGGEARGVMVEEVAGGVRLVTRPEMGVWLRRFFDVASGSKLSMAALETLAIVAYRQPVTGPEIQELRSVNPVGVLKTLLEKRLVRISGRKEVVGKPFLYATTREFLVHFGLNSLRDLPPLEEFEETFGAAAGAVAAGSPLTAAGTTGAWEAAATDAGSREGDRAVGETGFGNDGDVGMSGDEEDREERFLREAAELDEREEPADHGLDDRAGGGISHAAEATSSGESEAGWASAELDEREEPADHGLDDRAGGGTGHAAEATSSGEAPAGWEPAEEDAEETAVGEEETTEVER